MSTNPLSEWKSENRVRYVCSRCGAWREADPIKLIVSLVEGYEPNSEDAKAVAEAKKMEAPFMMRHLQTCGRKGGRVDAFYPEDPEYSSLDPAKREN